MWTWVKSDPFTWIQAKCKPIINSKSWSKLNTNWYFFVLNEFKLKMSFILFSFDLIWIQPYITLLIYISTCSWYVYLPFVFFFLGLWAFIDFVLNVWTVSLLLLFTSLWSALRGKDNLVMSSLRPCHWRDFFLRGGLFSFVTEMKGFSKIRIFFSFMGFHKMLKYNIFIIFRPLSPIHLPRLYIHIYSSLNLRKWSNT